MTTILLNENIWLLNKTFQNVDELITKLIDIKPWKLEEEVFTNEENKILQNRSTEIKNIEKDISSLLI